LHDGTTSKNVPVTETRTMAAVATMAAVMPLGKRKSRTYKKATRKTKRAQTEDVKTK
jgi:hypothetical protein